MAKSNVLAPYGIDPFAFLDAVEKNAPFTMGTVSPKDWATYEGILGQNEQRELQTSEAKKASQEKEDRKSVYANLSMTRPDGTPKGLGEIYDEVSKNELGYGNIEPTLKNMEYQDSKLKLAGKEAESKKKEEANLTSEIFKLAGSNPNAARALYQAYKKGGMLDSELEISDSLKKQSERAPDKSREKVSFREYDEEGNGTAYNAYGEKLNIKLQKKPPKGKKSSDAALLAALGQPDAKSTPAGTGPSFLDRVLGARPTPTPGPAPIRRVTIDPTRMRQR